MHQAALHGNRHQLGTVRRAEFGEQTAHVGLIIRLIDSTSGRVLDSQRVEGEAESGGIRADVDMGPVDFGGEKFSKTPLGKAVQQVIDNAVDIITAKTKEIPFEARIIKAAGQDVVIGAGQATGVSPGDVFAVYSLGEEMVDPDTGESLGSDESKIGTVKVSDVKEKFAKAHSVSGQGYEKGQIVRAE